LGTDLVSGKLTLPLLILAERLAPTERVELMDEIMGRRPPDLDLRLQQMQTADVFAAVAQTVEGELEAGELALRPFNHLAPVPLLVELAQVLRTQLASLRRN
jgi:octaprenyl-diphosphate synthase